MLLFVCHYLFCILAIKYLRLQYLQPFVEIVINYLLMIADNGKSPAACAADLTEKPTNAR